MECTVPGCFNQINGSITCSTHFRYKCDPGSWSAPAMSSPSVHLSSAFSPDFFFFLIHLLKNHSFHPLTITHVQLFCSTQDSLGPICPPCSTARAEIASYQKETNSPTSAPRVSSLQDADKSTVGETGVPNNYVIILPLFHQGCVCRIC